MTSVVTAPEPPLGSEDNPHPFKKGEKRIKNHIYFNSQGMKKSCLLYTSPSPRD